MTSATELLLCCPFCGGEAHTTETARYGRRYGVACLCGASMRFFDTEAEAIAAWNTRAERTCKREKHGRKMDGSWRMRCSECGYGIGDKRWNFCPKCGAKVVG